MLYQLLKSVHITAVILTSLFFVTRGVWMLRGASLLQKRWVRILPHIIDTILLASAAALTIVLQQFPFRDDWLTAKVIALVFYIALGSVTIKRGGTRTIRTWAFAGALLILAYIISVAVTRQIIPLTFDGISL